MSADQPFRNDQNLDVMRAEVRATNQALVLAKEENKLLKKKARGGAVHSVARVFIVGIAVSAAVYTGSGWFILIALLAVDSDTPKFTFDFKTEKKKGKKR